jgi:ABC-type lipoprotein export system ATPase subunit
VIQMDEVSFGYRKDDPIIDRISLCAERGTMTALTGPSGSGKSTLLYLAGLMVAPWSGSIAVDGRELTGLTDLERSLFRGRNIGFVFQDGCLDASRTVLDNVIEGTAYSGEARGAASEAALLLLERLGIDVDPHRKPMAISGGQAQRVAVCRALLPNPQIVLADEPTGNLDDLSAKVVLDELQAAARSGVVVVIATHDGRVVSRCDAAVELPS